MIWEKYIVKTESSNGRNGLLYNPKEDYLIKYSLEDFNGFDDLLNYKEIEKFLIAKGFIYDVELENNQANTIKDNKLSLIIKVTRDCNFNCFYCYERFNKTYLNIENANIILDFIKKYVEKFHINIITVSWFGGEPILNLGIIEYLTNELVKYAKSKNIMMGFSITTNGYLLTKNTIKRLLDNYISMFQITIDGDKVQHDQNRVLKTGEGTFDVIYNNLKSFKEFNNEFNVIIRTNFSKDMLNKMENYYKKISKLCRDERFSALFHTIVDFSNMEHLVTDMDILNEMKQAFNLGVSFSRATDFLKPEASECYAFDDNSFVIDSNLRVSKCTVSNFQRDFIGLINKDGELMTNENGLLYRAAKISEKCINCNDYVICNGGFCPLYYLNKGEARCMKFKEEYKKKELVKFADIQGYHDMYIHL